LTLESCLFLCDIVTTALDVDTVILCGTTLFKPLSSQQSADAETYDYCPVVRLQDSAEDFGYFLSVLLRADLYTPGVLVPFAQFAGVLRLANKYEATRTRIVLILEEIYPTTLEKFDLERRLFSQPIPHPDTGVMLLRECGIRRCIPTAMYRACEAGTDSLFAEEENACLPLSLPRTTMRGPIKLAAMEVAMAKLTTKHHTFNNNCQCHTIGSELASPLGPEEIVPDPLSNWPENVG